MRNQNTDAASSWEKHYWTEANDASRQPSIEEERVIVENFLPIYRRHVANVNGMRAKIKDQDERYVSLDVKARVKDLEA